MAPNGVQKVLASWLAGSVTQYVVAVVLGITGNPERHKLLNETGGHIHLWHDTMNLATIN